MQWTNEEVAGLLPEIFQENDPRTPIEQANDRYAHGGGWCDSWTKKAIEKREFILFSRKFSGIASLVYQSEEMRMNGENQETYLEVSRTKIRDWTIILFEGEWVAIVQDDQPSYSIARMS
jgi:hypothetical protein